MLRPTDRSTADSVQHAGNSSERYGRSLEIQVVILKYEEQLWVVLALKEFLSNSASVDEPLNSTLCIPIDLS